MIITNAAPGETVCNLKPPWTCWWVFRMERGQSHLISSQSNAWRLLFTRFCWLFCDVVIEDFLWMCFQCYVGSDVHPLHWQDLIYLKRRFHVKTENEIQRSFRRAHLLFHGRHHRKLRHIIVCVHGHHQRLTFSHLGLWRKQKQYKLFSEHTHNIHGRSFHQKLEKRNETSHCRRTDVEWSTRHHPWLRRHGRNHTIRFRPDYQAARRSTSWPGVTRQYRQTTATRSWTGRSMLPIPY